MWTGVACRQNALLASVESTDSLQLHIILSPLLLFPSSPCHLFPSSPLHLFTPSLQRAAQRLLDIRTDVGVIELAPVGAERGDDCGFVALAQHEQRG